SPRSCSSTRPPSGPATSAAAAPRRSTGSACGAARSPCGSAAGGSTSRPAGPTSRDRLRGRAGCTTEPPGPSPVRQHGAQTPGGPATPTPDGDSFMERNPITPEGFERLVADLKHHKSVLRPDVVRDIEEARAHGDLSENAEYDAAKDRQGHIEGRI